MILRSFCVFVIVVITGCSQSESTPTDASKMPESKGPEGPPLSASVASVDRPDNIDLTAPGVFQRSVSDSTIIDTSTWKKQIARIEPFEGESISSSSFRPVKRGKPVIEAGPVNDLIPGNVSNVKRVNHEMLFPGITRSPWNPPDPALGVGPNHIIETVNMELAFFSKSGDMQFQQRLDSTGSPGFFEQIGGGEFCFDPKCFYDHHANRYVVLALEVYTDIDEAWITIAVSDDDDPHGVWFKYRTWAVVEISNTTYWVDYPGLGYDENGYYITGNLFRLSGPGSGFGGVMMRAFDKAPMLSGQPVAFNDLRDGAASSAQVTQNFGANAAPYLVSRASSTQLRISAIDDPLGNPSLVTRLVDIPSSSSGPDAPNNGNSGQTITTLTGRIMNASCRDGRLWTCHSVASSNGSRTVARWYEINVGNWPTNGPVPTLVQSGEIDLGNSQFTFYPAIYTNANGNTGMVFANSSDNEFASVQGVGRQPSDPLGTMSIPEQLVIGNTTASGRWGDYFDIALDPTDGLTFWVVGEYMSPQGWKTAINSFSVEGPAIVIADSFNVTRGEWVAGTIAELAASDNQDVSLRRAAADIQSRTEMEIKGVSPLAIPTAMEITLEGSVFARSNVVQTIELFNYDTDAWELIDSRNGSRFSDEVVEVTVSGDVTRFVQVETLAVEARVRYQSESPRQQFSSNTDQFIWTINP